LPPGLGDRVASESIELFASEVLPKANSLRQG
jgi:hypothetical protein